LSCQHHYRIYGGVALVPDIVIDGGRNDNTVLSLSHRPKRGTPRTLNGQLPVAWTQ
jgi:hypothetical protein